MSEDTAQEAKRLAIRALQAIGKIEMRIKTHEAVCAERYRGIERSNATLRETLKEMNHHLEDTNKAILSTNKSINARVTSALVFVITILLGSVGYFYAKTHDRFTATDFNTWIKQQEGRDP